MLANIKVFKMIVKIAYDYDVFGKKKNACFRRPGRKCN
jgi:hypothetical protein